MAPPLMMAHPFDQSSFEVKVAHSSPVASSAKVHAAPTSSPSILSTLTVAPRLLVTCWMHRKSSGLPTETTVKENATLQFSDDGNLILRDDDGTHVWSTNTAGRSVAGMNLTEKGNLVLFDERNATVWDYPTDSLIVGQTLREGQRLTANVSETNWTEGQLFLTVVPGGFAAYADADPPQIYYSTNAIDAKDNSSTHLTFSNSSLTIFTLWPDQSPQNYTIPLPQASSIQYMRLESMGQFQVKERVGLWWLTFSS